MNPTAPALPIVPATPDCAAELLALQRLCYREEADLHHEPNIPPLTQTLDGLRDDFRTHTILAAWNGGRLVGSVRGRREGSVCQIGRLIVHPDHRQQGLGGALLAAIEAAFPDITDYELFTGERSERNLHFYARRGYRQVGRQAVSPRLALIFLRKRRG